MNGKTEILTNIDSRMHTPDRTVDLLPEILPEKHEPGMIDINDESENETVKKIFKDTKKIDNKLTSDKIGVPKIDKPDNTPIRPTNISLDGQTDYMSLGARPKVIKKLPKKEKNRGEMKLYGGSKNSRYRSSDENIGTEDNIITNEDEHIANDVTEAKSIRCQVSPKIEREIEREVEAEVGDIFEHFEHLNPQTRIEDQSMLVTLKTPEVKCLENIQKGGGVLSRMDNILDKPTSEKIAEILSPARRIRRGTVASMRAKFENFGRAECETDDSENKKRAKEAKNYWPEATNIG